MALVKALRQYHFASNVLKGYTQWKFQKSQILHHVLDAITLHMEDSKRCLDFHDSMPVDQTFRHHDPNLHHLKAVTVKEVTHLTMILMLDEDHTHYSNAFGNIFEEDTLHKKCFPNGPQGIMTSKAGAAHAIVMNGYVSKIREHVQSHQKKRSDPACLIRRTRMRDQDLSQMASQVMKRGCIGDSQGEENDRKWSGSGSNGVSLDTLDRDSD